MSILGIILEHSRNLRHSALGNNNINTRKLHFLNLSLAHLLITSNTQFIFLQEMSVEPIGLSNQINKCS